MAGESTWAAFHLEPEVLDGTEGSQKLSVKSTVVGLSTVQLLGEESQGPPGQHYWCRAAPKWVALASATRASLAWGEGCDSSASVERLFLAMLKAVSMKVKLSFLTRSSCPCSCRSSHRR